MLGRVANTIYWMNRHLERAENYARFMDVNFNLSLNYLLMKYSMATTCDYYRRLGTVSVT
jgi:uncharacterized alpha-E superfamily protein